MAVPNGAGAAAGAGPGAGLGLALPAAPGGTGGGLRAAAGLYEQLKGEWGRKSPNLAKCGEALGRLKVALLDLNFLPTSGSAMTKQQLILARDILEIGAQWSILRKDIPSKTPGGTGGAQNLLEHPGCSGMSQNVPEPRREELPESASWHQLLGLNLLFLLSQNRVAEFHTELERLPAPDIQGNLFIRHPVSLEQYLMEGSYNKVFLAKGNIPAESYTFFIDILLDTIRDEIAGCIEAAYERILFPEAARILFFSSPRKMTDYAKKRGWVLGPSNYYSFGGRQQKAEDPPIPSTELATQVIEYARQLEMIV
ncbi:LOW QUALITY PROTEIN: 26S proteasome non-ATPase regulatory subunit 8 [Camarhynchus parvulus]|uniref:LOW QUALITY PROTEIN: 26S proteasome non-ATPase regulatory subunit 8 n=1 Tax=Geospiza parvula TaxID=87175 RepID=UPI001237A167|nr:LOW QUALITY PROTEIN: 26S proteasome non-ATPase regulatory subunit 8 [Camarhynchus parvulus]